MSDVNEAQAAAPHLHAQALAAAPHPRAQAQTAAPRPRQAAVPQPRSDAQRSAWTRRFVARALEIEPLAGNARAARIAALLWQRIDWQALPPGVAADAYYRYTGPPARALSEQH